MVQTVNNFFWDLDGTLTNPQKGIIHCLQYTFAKSYFPLPPEDQLRWVIGPPIYEIFSRLLPGEDDAQIWQMIALFRERFAEVGIFENEIYSFVPSMFEALQGRINFLATSKAKVYAHKIMSHFQIEIFFNGIYGSELDGTRSNKSDLLKFILDKENIESKNVVMIGDRKHDIYGAKANNILSVGVTWGFGSKQELENAGADFIFEDPSALTEFLISISKK